MAAQGHQAPDGRRFAETYVAHDNGPAPAPLAGLTLPQDLLQPQEQPITAHEGGVSSQAGNLEQKRLQQDVWGSEQGQPP